MDPDLTALTATAATTVVQLLATAAWRQAGSAVGGLWRRVHPQRAETVVFSPDGHTLATGSKDQTVRLWNVTDPAHPTPLGQPLTGHTDEVNAVAFSPDGHTLATGSDQTVRLWAMNIDQAIQRICATTRNNLTPEKWKQYVSPDLPYDPPYR